MLYFFRSVSINQKKLLLGILFEREHFILLNFKFSTHNFINYVTIKKNYQALNNIHRYAYCTCILYTCSHELIKEERDDNYHFFAVRKKYARAGII
jgi:hypothetical protein